jgi:hypothetical protein
LIASAKSSSHPAELYSERIRAIRWFEEHHPDRFDLYGIGWPAEHFPSYRGPVPHKAEVLPAYRFAIAYENIAGIPGYVTEKIFDSFICGTVPIYWGASNIEDYVPADCFIDLRDFTRLDELYHRLATMTDAEHQGYLDRIADLLQRERYGRFSTTHFVRDMLAHTLTIPPRAA